MQFELLKVNQRFGETCHIHLQSRRISQAGKQRESRRQAESIGLSKCRKEIEDSKSLPFGSPVAQMSKRIPSSRRWTPIRLHGATSGMTVIFTVTVLWASHLIFLAESWPTGCVTYIEVFREWLARPEAGLFWWVVHLQIATDLNNAAAIFRTLGAVQSIGTWVLQTLNFHGLSYLHKSFVICSNISERR
jgi:hypothetical protein